VGTREDFAALAEAHAGGIYAYFRRLGVEATAAEDLAQETFLTAWENLGALRDQRRIRSWLYGIAYRRYLKHRESAACHATVPISEELAERGGDPANERSLSAQAVRAVVQGLPDEYRQALVLVYWEDLSYKEAARALALPLGTFAWRVHKALKLARKALAEEQGSDESERDEQATGGRPDPVREG